MTRTGRPYARSVFAFCWSVFTTAWSASSDALPLRDAVKIFAKASSSTLFHARRWDVSAPAWSHASSLAQLAPSFS